MSKRRKVPADTAAVLALFDKLEKTEAEVELLKKENRELRAKFKEMRLNPAYEARVKAER